jgi:adenine-specific DNA-methyltransferase
MGMSITPQKMRGESLDISAENRFRLKNLFPSVFTETINDKGDLVESVDFEKLKAELGTFADFFEGSRERYSMEWPGKKDALRLIQTPLAATLKPCRDESIHFDTTENLFIEGENLEVLKLLQKSYYGQVKMIYIDPPYNTGNNFIYPDNFTDSLGAYLKYAGLVDGNGKKHSTNTANEGRFHTKWLNMMYPRLYLARNLLRDDGVIFISIDDHEVANLRKLCDEIFGEENFVAQSIWRRRVSSGLSENNVSMDHEYVVCYQKNKIVFNGLDKDFKGYANPDNDSRGPWKLDNLTVGMSSSMRPNQAYDLIDPKTGKKYPFNPNRVWAFIPSSMNRMIKEGRIVFPDNTSKRPMLKRFKFELKTDKNPFSTIIIDQVGLNTEATRMMQQIFKENIFEYSKPISLLKVLLTQVTSQDDVILDFFAGSATTAHAVLDLNKQDGGNRQFILVQLPEPCAPESEAFKAGYKTIADIGKERIRRVIKKLNEEDGGKVGGKSADRGFKVLKLG